MSTSDAARRSSPDAGASAADRDALIEQFLLTGLDRYFAGRYEDAIHVWTRVFFLDRGHARARAYIERARGALAERQREAEAAAHVAGETALDGTLDIASWRPRTTGKTLLAPPRIRTPRRLRRRDLMPLPADLEGLAPIAEASTGRLWTHVVLVTLAAVLLFGAGYVVADRDRIANWWKAPTASTRTPSVTLDPLPVPRASERALARARALYARGRVHDAVRELATIRVDDPLRPQADGLLVDLQRALLGMVAASSASDARPRDPSGPSER